MHGKKQSRNLFLHIISRAAMAALAIAVVFVLTVVVTPSVQAQTPATSGGWTEQVLYHFIWNGNPEANVIFDAAGNLYSTTDGGTSSCGAYGYGQVFELMASLNARGGRWMEKGLHGFNFNGKDGVCPEAGLIFDAAGNLYGTTVGGGTNGGGTVFELMPGPSAIGGWREKVLYNFGNGSNSDGFWPSAGLIFDASGNLYGTTTNGGSFQCFSYGYQCGTVFELTPTAGGGWTETVLHVFNNNGPDGATPNAGLIFDAAGDLYGTTSVGGTYGGGTVFELTPTGGGDWAETVLWSFGGGTDGAAPYAGLIFDAAGNLYGTTQGGGTYASGTAFELSPTGGGGWSEQVLYNFKLSYPSVDGGDPLAGLIFDTAGNLYGTTSGGGAFGYGTVFELSPSGGGTWTEQLLYNFDNDSGASPWASLIFHRGNLYGTTAQGGNYGNGTVFELMRN